MMDVQLSKAAARGVQPVTAEAPLRLPARAGELRVLQGAVWLTRRGDFQDHLLRAGQRLRLAAGDAVVIERWQAGQPATVDWQPHGPRAALRRSVAMPAARTLGTLAAATAALTGALRRAEAGVAARAGSGAA